MQEGRTVSKHMLMSGLLPGQWGPRQTRHLWDTVPLRGKPAGLLSIMAYPSVVDVPLGTSILGYIIFPVLRPSTPKPRKIALSPSERQKEAEIHRLLGKDLQVTLMANEGH